MSSGDEEAQSDVQVDDVAIEAHEALPETNFAMEVLHADPVNVGAARDYLSGKSWPIGLQSALLQGLQKIPIRYFICDDSGSMTTMDGMRFQESEETGINMMSCSRWAELADSLEFHAELAHYASAPTEFRLLNHDKPMRVGYGGDDEDEDGKTALDEFLTIIQKRPYGQTPLCKHIAEVVQEVGLIADDLRQAGQMACLVIASDGEATDGKLVKAMLPLKSLPVWVVIRLCTNDPQVLKYWNEIDSELELNMDVIDDFYGEAVEVKRVNPWLTYGEPLQRIREFGVYIKDLDLLDENPCSLAQIRHICSLIFGVTEAEIERPEADWKGFCRRIQGLNASTPPVVSPVSVAGQPREWIKLHRLDRRGIKKKPTCAIS